MKRWDWIKFLGIELDSVGVEVMKDGFPWKDVDACLGNEAEPPIVTGGHPSSHSLRRHEIIRTPLEGIIDYIEKN